VIEQALHLLHPLMPFLTEELWEQLGFCRHRSASSRRRWPSHEAVANAMPRRRAEMKLGSSR